MAALYSGGAALWRPRIMAALYYGCGYYGGALPMAAPHYDDAITMYGGCDYGAYLL
jgi:hypothetical protein